MFRCFMAASLACLVVSLTSVAHAQKNSPENWELIVSEALDPATSTISINTTKAKGSVRALRIQMRKQGVEITHAEFGYADGTVYTLDRRFALRPGERTKAIDEKDAERFLDRVNLTYSVPRKGKRRPVVDIYALQSTAGRKATREAAPAVASAGQQTGQIETSATDSQPITVEAGAIIEGRDVMFGYQNVGFVIDNDQIVVGSDIGKFDYLRLRVLENAVHINQLQVNYVNGTSQVLAVDADIGANQKTMWFRVNGKEFIKDIRMSYKSKPNFKGQARVEVLGQFAKGWLDPQGEGRQYNQGWVMLGSQTAGALGYDKDTVGVGQNEGGFKRVRLNVRDRSITLREVRIVYTSGTDEVIKMYDKVDPGQTAGPWDLKVGAAPIKEIVATYRTRLIFGKGRGAAVVEFWGQH